MDERQKEEGDKERAAMGKDMWCKSLVKVQIEIFSLGHINNWAAMTVSSPVSVTGSQKRTHSNKAKARETVGGGVWEGGKLGS